MSWFFSTAGKGKDAGDAVAATLDSYSDKDSPVLMALRDLSKAVAEACPDCIVVIESNGHVDPTYGGSCTFTARAFQQLPATLSTSTGPTAG